jgi:biopolymer transport protein ExbD
MGAKVASGGGKKKRGAYAANADMNVIPFIDILLVLLIIFMVAAPVPTVDVKVDLPPPVPPIESQEEPKKPTLVDIVDPGDGTTQVFVDGRFTEVADLNRNVFGAISVNVPGSGNPLEEEVKVRAAQTLPYASVMGVMATLQEGGFIGVTLIAETALDESQMQ